MCVHSPMMLKGKLENGCLCVRVYVCVFWVVEVPFLCFLGWERGNNGHIVWRVGKEERGRWRRRRRRRREAERIGKLKKSGMTEDEGKGLEERKG